MNSNYKPGEARRKKFAFDKGRQLDSLSLKEVKDILPLNDIRRDHLIEYLHILQDKFKFLYSSLGIKSLFLVGFANLFQGHIDKQSSQP